MTAEQILIVAIMGMTLGFFIWGRLRYDIVAALALFACAVGDLVPTDQVFAGFGHPAVITVAAVLILSAALRNSGVVDLIAARIRRFTTNQFLHIISLMLVVTVASAFMNNVGALALMLPVALVSAAEQQRSPAILLMPLAFGSILGGMTTMIGTPPNVIIASYRQSVSGAPFGMFDFSPVGLAVAIGGLIFVAVIGWRLIPRARRTANVPSQLFETDDYLTETRVPEDSGLIGKTVQEVEAFRDGNVEIVGRARGASGAIFLPQNHVIEAGDVIILRADTDALKKLIEEHDIDLVTESGGTAKLLTSETNTLVEALVPHKSWLVGREVAALSRRVGERGAVIALSRRGAPLRERLRRQRFQVGDILLLQMRQDLMADTLLDLELLPLAHRDINLASSHRIGLAGLIFGGALAAGIAGLVSLPVAFIGAIIAFTLTGILSVRELYDNVDWPVIVLLGAMIPVGQALENTGTTLLVAEALVEWTRGLPLAVVLGLILVVTMFLSDVINNAATAVVMAPIAVGVANALGASIDPFLMAVAVGASCAFLTPIGHQSNTLVMGPGGYQFTDYWRMGLPLEILIVAISVPLILIVWPA
ncbi:MAG TPA: SLC13 family permease [Alphaproteobacteria bacterium]|nr:SLC13 family permease [Alphaproteobacteria bacterium]HAM48740.1 SLC13 family permease [Alphaproteobacteria bacterium]HBA42438.1 SLC13 family permease [Alphaproteobacteria bacterium]HCO90801.1 SLC13 family permease [Alphaproteobacteria bacterium]